MSEIFLSVRQVMQGEPVAVAPTCPLRDAIAVMNERRIGAVLVVHPDRTLAGIFTERDLLRRVNAAEPGWRELPISGWMTKDRRTLGLEYRLVKGGTR